MYYNVRDVRTALTEMMVVHHGANVAREQSIEHGNTCLADITTSAPGTPH